MCARPAMSHDQTTLVMSNFDLVHYFIWELYVVKSVKNYRFVTSPLPCTVCSWRVAFSIRLFSTRYCRALDRGRCWIANAGSIGASAAACDHFFVHKTDKISCTAANGHFSSASKRNAQIRSTIGYCRVRNGTASAGVDPSFSRRNRSQYKASL